MVKSALVVLYRMGVVCVLLESIFYCTLSELAISIPRYGLISFITINFYLYNYIPLIIRTRIDNTQCGECNY